MSMRQSSDVGITEFLGTHAGFEGVIKMRFQDFIVNEIDESDNIVHLTDMSLPKTNDDDADKRVGNADILLEEDKQKLAELAKNPDGDYVEIKPGESKDERTEVHNAIRWLYPELASQTINDEEGNKIIKVVRAKQSQRSDRNRSRRSLCKFVLHKQNIGTMEAINFIAKKLHIRKANGFQYAGTKDKRGVTTQLVTAPVAAERLCGLNKLDSNIKVGNFLYCTKPLQLGALKGNHFSLVIRNVSVTKDSLAATFKSFSANGFVNYFGLQRFGTSSIPTHSVGIALLRSEWENAISLILEPRKDDKDNGLTEALKKYSESGDADAALNCLRYRSSIEGLLLQGLKRFGKSQLLQAITVIPRNTRKMYVHAYQSYVWNKIASKRIKELGAEPVTGDLVFASLYNYRKEAATKNSSEHHPPPLKRPRKAEDDQMDLKSVIAIPAEDRHLFSLEDIILPLPGHDIQYPGGKIKSWYNEVMEKDGIDIDKHMVHKVKDYSLPGDYRYLVTRPSHVNYDSVRYDDFCQPLLQNDLDKLKGAAEPTGVDEGRHVAVRVHFSLPSSSYATIALRELMKTDISLSAQIKKNEEHETAEDVIPA